MGQKVLPNLILMRRIIVWKFRSLVVLEQNNNPRYCGECSKYAGCTFKFACIQIGVELPSFGVVISNNVLLNSP